MFKINSILILTLLVLPLVSHAKETVSNQEVIIAMKQGIPGVKKLLKKVSLYENFVENKTLLHYAVENGNYKVVVFLVNKGILLSQKAGKFYGTALHTAIYHNHIRIANFLIQKGTPSNTKDVTGNTALHIAATNGHLGLIKMLLNHGASRHILNNNGHSPYQLLPTLTWEDKDEMEKLLETTPPPIKYNINSKNRKIIKEWKSKSKVSQKSTKNLKKIDKKTTVVNSHIGISIKTNK